MVNGQLLEQHAIAFFGEIMSCSCETVHQGVSTVSILQVTKCWGSGLGMRLQWPGNDDKIGTHPTYKAFEVISITTPNA